MKIDLIHNFNEIVAQFIQPSFEKTKDDERNPRY